MQSPLEPSQARQSAGKLTGNFFLYEQPPHAGQVPNSPKSLMKTSSEQGTLPRFSGTQQNFASGRHQQGFRQGEYFRSTLANSTKRQLEVIAAHGLPNLKSSLSSAWNSVTSDHGGREMEGTGEASSVYNHADFVLAQKHRSHPQVLPDTSKSELLRETDMSSGAMMPSGYAGPALKHQGEKLRSKQRIEALSTTLHLR